MTLSLMGVALAAAQGSQSDPLVTLSYLNEKAMPSILSQVDAKLTQRESALKAQLEQVADSYAQQVQGSGGTGGSASVYQVVTLKQGQQLIAGAACEILLRSGTAVCVSDSSPGLVDMTDGSALAPGGALSANHLYLATIDGRGVKASGAVTLMVRGNYNIR